MTVRERELAYLRRQRVRLRKGDHFAAANIAAAYRILGKHALAFRWWKRSAEQGYGDELLEVGYCYQHGAGVRRDTRAAERAYRAAISSRNVTQFGREEAMYHLAVLLFQRNQDGSSSEVRRLLRRANADGDYPQAAILSSNVSATGVNEVCVCRRGLRRGLSVLKCPLHR
jgi:TPR repeat protein